MISLNVRQSIYVALGCLVLTASALAADGVVQSASGAVFVNGSPAAPGDSVSAGDTLSTAEDAAMTVVMNDDSVIELRTATEVTVLAHVYDAANVEDNAQLLQLVDGDLGFTSGKIAKNDPNDVYVMAGLMGVTLRGTIFDITYKRDSKEVVLKMKEGVTNVDLASLGLEVNGKPVQIDPKTGEVTLKVTDGKLALTVANPGNQFKGGVRSDAPMTMEFAVEANAQGKDDLKLVNVSQPLRQEKTINMASLQWYVTDVTVDDHVRNKDKYLNLFRDALSNTLNVDYSSLNLVSVVDVGTRQPRRSSESEVRELDETDDTGVRRRKPLEEEVDVISLTTFNQAIINTDE